jgi:hypothetical protein
MSANLRSQEKYLIEWAVSWFDNNLPAAWKAEASSLRMGSPDPSRPDQLVDGLITIAPLQGASISFLVEATSTFAPRDAELFLMRMARQLRVLSPNYPILVVTPWLSERSQEILTSQNINYLDFTGNVRIALDWPSVFISSKGATRNPQPDARAAARLKGPKAGRLARFLLDVTPPYGVSQIAEVTGLAPGYVSRLLKSLDDGALIERTPRGQVLSVDIPRLLKRWTETYDVFKSNAATSYVAPRGIESILSRLASPSPDFPAVVVTGSFSAVRFAPVAAPSLLILYCSEPSALTKEFRLLPADRGSNVVVLRPFDEVVWQRTTEESGIRYAATSQTAADCLTGNGRMPAEGDALTQWLVDNQSQWRLNSISDIGNVATMEN